MDVEVRKERGKDLRGEQGTGSVWVGWKDCWKRVLEITSWVDKWEWLDSGC